MIVDVGGPESGAWISRYHRVCLRSVGWRTQIVIHVEYIAGCSAADAARMQGAMHPRR